MKVIQRGFELSSIDYYKTHLRLVNAVFPVGITEREIDIIAHFLSLPKDITKDDMFSATARKRVIDILKLTPGGMSNHIKNMKKKGYLKREGDCLVVVPALVPDGICQGYNFKLKMRSYEN